MTIAERKEIMTERYISQIKYLASILKAMNEAEDEEKAWKYRREFDSIVDFLWKTERMNVRFYTDKNAMFCNDARVTHVGINFEYPFPDRYGEKKLYLFYCNVNTMEITER